MSFSLWCDFVENEFIKTELVELIQSGKINGATSNPSIFKNAILTSNAYKSEIELNKHLNPKALYELLAVRDIQNAANKFALNYLKDNDGFVSLEIDPRLYDKTSESIFEAKRLYAQISKDNVMMKVPATNESFEVMTELLSSGINVNATLIFSLEQTKKCVDALNDGLKKFKQKQPYAIKFPKAVISVFVSRFDRILNNRIKYKNKFGIANAKLAYDYIISNADSNIKTLFASIGVKGDDLPKDYYINALAYESSINTAPLDSIYAYKPNKSLLFDDDALNIVNSSLLDGEYEKICKDLLDDGLKQFCIAFEEILTALKQ